METKTKDSAIRLKEAKERLKNSLSRLERLIQKQNSSIKQEKIIKTQIIKDFDSHIKNLETILETNS